MTREFEENSAANNKHSINEVRVPRFPFQSPGAAAAKGREHASWSQQSILALQRRFGNRHVQRMIQRQCNGGANSKCECETCKQSRETAADTSATEEAPAFHLQRQDNGGIVPNGTGPGSGTTPNGLAGGAPADGTAASAFSCTPGSGISNSTCSAYAANSWWLPFAYVNNATCACVSTPNVPTANCVRKFLQDRLAGESGFLKAAAAAQKLSDVPGSPTYPAYQAFIQAVLTPGIYQDHVDAYRSCCCPSGPASYEKWMAVTSIPIQPCTLVGWFIDHFGSCSGTPGSW